MKFSFFGKPKHPVNGVNRQLYDAVKEIGVDEEPVAVAKVWLNASGDDALNFIVSGPVDLIQAERLATLLRDTANYISGTRGTKSSVS